MTYSTFKFCIVAILTLKAESVCACKHENLIVKLETIDPQHTLTLAKKNCHLLLLLNLRVPVSQECLFL